jgi:hypothetical protein
VSTWSQSSRSPRRRDVRYLADLEAQRFAHHALERRGLSRCGPELELRVARRTQPQHVVVAPVVQFEAADSLRMTAVEAFRQPQDRRQRADGSAPASPQIAVAVVAALGRAAPVVARDESDRFDLVRLEPPQIAVLDQVVRVPMMLFVADEDADVVEDRGVLEPFALAIGEPVDRPRLIEQRRGQPRDLLRVFRIIVTALGELEHAPAADVRVAIRLRDFLAVTCDVVEDEPFAQRQIAQRHVVGAEAANELVQQHDARHDEIGAPRLEAYDSEPFIEIERDELLARPADLLGRDAAVAQRRVERQPFGRGDDRAHAQDRAGRADHAIEAGTRDLAQVLADLRVDVLHEPALVAMLQRIAADEAFGQSNDAKLETAAQVDGCAGAARHLHAATADVDDHGGVRRHADAVDRCEVDQPGFFGSGDQARPDARLLRDRLQELAAVLRLARRARGHGDNLFNPMRFGQTPEFR